MFSALAPLFDEIMHVLTHKRGFIVIKGFPTINDEYSAEKIKKSFLEFSRHLGIPLIQNRSEDLIFDVKSIEGVTFETKNARGPHVKDSIPMHTDRC
jgi:hypothetical protein